MDLPGIRKSILIKTTPQAVWEMIDFEKLPEWLGFVKKFEWASEDKDETGSIAYMTVVVWGSEVEVKLEMTEFVKNEKRAWRGAGDGMTIIGSWTLSPTESGTKVNVVLEFAFPKSSVGKMMSKMSSVFAKVTIEKEVEKGLKKLRETLEK